MRHLPLLVLSLLVPALATAGQAKNWKEDLESAVKTLYPQTEFSRFDQSNVTKSGVVLVVRKPNLMGEPVSNTASSVNKAIDGEFKAPSGLGAFFQSSKNRMFKVGDKVYMTDFRVNDDSFMIRVLSTELYDIVDKGTTKPQRVRSFVRFEVPRAQMSTMTAAQVKALIEPLFGSESEAGRTIAIGQTRAEVESILGKPSTIVDLPERVTYVYPNLKIVFQDGKVADVQ